MLPFPASPPVSPATIRSKSLGVPPIESFAAGIVGDGTTDDSAALKSAHDAAYAAGVREVYCGRKYYAPTLWNAGNVHFRGPGSLLGTYRKKVIPFGTAPGTFAGGVNPAQHLQRFARQLNPVAGIMGDSTGTVGANELLGSNLWNLLQSALMRDNPTPATVTRNNYSIGGTTLSNFNQTGTQLLAAGIAALPAFFTAAGANWPVYAQNASVGLLICNWGTNGPTGTTTPGWAAVKTIVNAFTTYVPDLILCTNLPPSTQVYSGSAMQSALDQRDFAAGVTRTYAEFFGLGLLDFHRQACMARDGFDPVDTYLLPTSYTANATALPWTATSYTTDFRLTFEINNAGDAMFSAGQYYSLALSAMTSNELRFERYSSQYLRCIYYHGNGTAGAGFSGVVIPTNGILHCEVVVRGGWVSVYAESVLILECLGIRGGGQYLPSITSSAGAVSGKLNITSYWTSSPRLCQPTLLDVEMFGTTDLAYPGGGNGNNHPADAAMAHVYKPVLDRTNFSTCGLVAQPTQSVTAAGAIDARAGYIKLTGPASGSYAITLAAPAATDLGRTLTIEMVATTGSNSVTLALSNCDGGTAATTCTWSAAAQKLVLVAGVTKWTVLKQQGVTLT